MLAPAGLELAEEPVHGVDALRHLRAASPVPVAMDETAAEPGASAAGAVDAVCLKVSRCGGISGLLREAPPPVRPAAPSTSRRRSTGRSGSPPPCTPPPPWSPTGRSPPAGSRRSGAFEDVEDPFVLRDGALAVPAGPGLVG